MENDIKKEARKQFFHYFRLWFIAIGVLLLISIGLAGLKLINSRRARTNHESPAERVYDYADVLTDEEEEKLRAYIAQKEKELHIDIVLVTFNRAVEGQEAKEQYGYRSVRWEDNMQDIADDFWDENKFGYNRGFEGDGILFLHNLYEGQSGGHLNTSGRVETAFSDYDIDRVMDAIQKNFYQGGFYQAYRAYIDTVAKVLDGPEASIPFSGGMFVVISLIAALIYAAKHLVQSPAQNTTAVNAYVIGGKPVMNRKTDAFLRKSVTQRRIETSSGSSRGGGSHSSGGGGHHVSRSGASHGGGSRRF